MIYADIMLTLIFAALSLNAALVICGRRKRKNKPEAALKEAPKEEKDKFNEGFENIMTYAVNGRNRFEGG